MWGSVSHLPGPALPTGLGVRPRPVPTPRARWGDERKGVTQTSETFVSVVFPPFYDLFRDPASPEQGLDRPVHPSDPGSLRQKVRDLGSGHEWSLSSFPRASSQWGRGVRGPSGLFLVRKRPLR